MKQTLILIVLAIAIAAFITPATSGCTDATFGKLKALGDSASVQCYSGGKLIYKGFSTGKVASEANSDGYYFIDRDLNLPVEVSGNCVIVYGDNATEYKLPE